MRKQKNKKIDIIERDKDAMLNKRVFKKNMYKPSILKKGSPLPCLDIINNCLRFDNYFLVKSFLDAEYNKCKYAYPSFGDSIESELNGMELKGEFKTVNVEFAFPFFNPEKDNPKFYSGDIFEKIELATKDERLSAIKRWKKEVYDVDARAELRRLKLLKLSDVKTFNWLLSLEALDLFRKELVTGKFIKQPPKGTFESIFGNVPALEVVGKIMWLPTHNNKPNKAVLFRMLDQLKNKKIVQFKEIVENKLIQAFFIDPASKPFNFIRQSKHNVGGYLGEYEEKLKVIFNKINQLNRKV